MTQGRRSLAPQSDPHERLAALYAGRRDVWGAVEGRQMKSPLTPELWYQHVHGDMSVGVYPLIWHHDILKVKWCGVDIDEGDELIALAINVHRALSVLGIASWVERSKGKGYHVLCFLSDWVPATTARNAMLFACQLANYKPKEVYPKQTELEAGQAGNYLNAAYAKRWADEGRRVMIEPNGPHRGVIPLSMFLHVAEESLVSPQLLHKAAALYKPPPPPRPVVFDRSTDVWLDRRVRGVAGKLLYDGPLPDLTTGRIDRSAALQRLAHLLRKDGFTAGEALSLVSHFDTRHDMGKYVGRKDAGQRYEEIVSRAYG